MESYGLAACAERFSHLPLDTLVEEVSNTIAACVPIFNSRTFVWQSTGIHVFTVGMRIHTRTWLWSELDRAKSPTRSAESGCPAPPTLFQTTTTLISSSPTFSPGCPNYYTLLWARCSKTQSATLEPSATAANSTLQASTIASSFEDRYMLGLCYSYEGAVFMME